MHCNAKNKNQKFVSYDWTDPSVMYMIFSITEQVKRQRQKACLCTFLLMKDVTCKVFLFCHSKALLCFLEVLKWNICGHFVTEVSFMVSFKFKNDNYTNFLFIWCLPWTGKWHPAFPKIKTYCEIEHDITGEFSNLKHPLFSVFCSVL